MIAIMLSPIETRRGTEILGGASVRSDYYMTLPAMTAMMAVRVKTVIYGSIPNGESDGINRPIARKRIMGSSYYSIRSVGYDHNYPFERVGFTEGKDRACYGQSIKHTPISPPVKSAQSRRIISLTSSMHRENSANLKVGRAPIPISRDRNPTRNLYSLVLLLITLLISTTQISTAEVSRSTLDSLWIRASSGMIRHQDEVKPSKEALVEYGEEAVEFLVEKMDTRSAREMHTLVDILGKIGSVATDEVCEQLNSDDPYRVRLACRTLGRIEDSSAVECLLPHADDTLYTVRSGVASALGEIAHRSATETLLRLAQDEDYIVRKSATVSLGKMPFESVYQRLMANLSDDYYGVRYTAAASLAGYEKKAVPAIKGYITENLNINSTDLPQNRIFSVALAIDCLGKISDKKSSKMLKKIIDSDNDGIIRAYAARSLGEIGGKSNRKFLVKMENRETDPFVSQLLADAIVSASKKE
ncbi:MAG: hypothetical protein GF315_06100 [candidate division Zixibacteria bacterium]|nr:hypothetical protein [candidate division Zixibacteria bacterium]